MRCVALQESFTPARSADSTPPFFIRQRLQLAQLNAWQLFFVASFRDWLRRNVQGVTILDDVTPVLDF